MFFIKVVLKSKSLAGLTALDERRRLRLEDSSYLYFGEGNVKVEIDERFARLYSKYFLNADTSVVYVPHDVLTPKEISRIDGGYHSICNITPERAKELFVFYNGMEEK